MSDYFIPAFTGVIEAYTKRFVHSNLWRIQDNLEFEDMMQESYIVFLNLSRRYCTDETPSEKRIDNAAWFMGIYKSALSNRVTDLAYKSSKIRGTSSLSEVHPESESELVETLQGELENEGCLYLALKSLPVEVASVFKMLGEMTPDVRATLALSWKARNKKSPFCNAHLLELSGLSENPYYKKNPICFKTVLTEALTN